MKKNNSRNKATQCQKIVEKCTGILDRDYGENYVFNVLCRELGECGECERKEVLEKLCSNEIISDEMMKAYLYFIDFASQMDKSMSENNIAAKEKFCELFERIPPECYDILFPIIKSRFFDKIEPEIIRIPNGVTQIEDDAFRNCRYIKEVYIPDSVTYIGYFAFSDCRHLEKAVISMGVTTIESSAFSDCDRLEKIVIPDTVTELGSNMFENCLSLKEVRLPKDLKVLPFSCFRDCSNLRTVVLPKQLKKIERCAFMGSGIEKIIIPEGVTEIMDGAFNITSLEYVNLPSTLNTVEEDIFGYCDKLKAINIPADNSYFATIDGVLFNHDLKTLIRYPQNKPDKTYRVPCETEKITDWAFRQATNLNIVYMSNVREIGEHAFVGSSIQNIVLPGSLEKMEAAVFTHCENLLTVSIQGNLREISDYCFGRCSSLMEVRLQNGIEKINKGAFSSCNNLTQFVMPSSVNEVGVRAFADCDKLKLLTISNSIKEIPEDFFTFDGNCGKRIIQIPEGVECIDDNAIKGRKSEVVIVCKEGSAAYRYAVDKGYEVNLF